WRRRAGDAVQAVGRFLRLLATRACRLGQPPTDDPRGLDARDRLLGPVERTENRLLNQLTLAVIGDRHGLDAHDPLGKLTRRHRLDRIAQLVVDDMLSAANILVVAVAT